MSYQDGSPASAAAQLSHVDPFNQQACSPVYLVVTMYLTADAAEVP
jgi:hypothetical protein